MPITYIRLLKATLLPDPTDSTCLKLTCVLTLTSDLAETSYAQPSPLIITLARDATEHKYIQEWTGLKAVEKYEITVPKSRFSLGKTKSDILNCDWTLSISAYAKPQKTRRKETTELEKSLCSADYLTDFTSCPKNEPVIIGLSTILQSGLFEQIVRRDFQITDDLQLQILEGSQDSIESHLWDSSVLLGALLCTTAKTPVSSALSNTLTKSETIIELGSGTGLLGLLIALKVGSSKSRRIVMTDLPDAEPLITQSMLLNQTLVRRVEYRPLDWTIPEQSTNLIERHGSGDVLVVMTDVIYNDAFHDALFETIERLTVSSSKERKTRIVMMSKYRHISERPFIERLLEAWRVERYVIIDGSKFIEKSTDENDVPAKARIGDLELLILTNSLYQSSTSCSSPALQWCRLIDNRFLRPPRIPA